MAEALSGTRVGRLVRRHRVLVFLCAVVMAGVNALVASTLKASQRALATAATVRVDGLACDELVRLAVWSRGNHGLSEKADFRSRAFAEKTLDGFVTKLDPYRLLFTEAEAKEFRRQGGMLWTGLLDGAHCGFVDEWVSRRFPVAKERFWKRFRGLPASAFFVRAPRGKAANEELKLKRYTDFAKDEAELSRRLANAVKSALAASTPLLLKTYGGDRIGYAADTLTALLFESAPAPRALLAKAMLGALDPFSTYLSPAEFDDFYGDLAGGASGIGIRVRRVPKGLLVEKVLEDTPAAASRIKEGDIIVSVDGMKVTTLPSKASKRLLSGPEASRVKLTIERAGRKPFVESLVRRRFVFDEARIRYRELPSPASPTEKIAVVEVPSFYGRGGMASSAAERSSAEDLKRVLSEMLHPRRGTGTAIGGLVLDMRGNPGGYLEEAVSMAGLFLGDEAVVGVVESRDRRVLRSDGATPIYHGPLVVLVDKESASAAEIVAGALRDHQRAVLVGSGHTYGKGTVQKLFHLDEVAMRIAPMMGKLGTGVVKLTTSVFYSPLGHSPANGGIPTHIAISRSSQQHDSREDGFVASVPEEAPFVEPTKVAELERHQPRLDAQVAELRRLSEARRRQELLQADDDGAQELEEAVAIAADWSRLSKDLRARAVPTGGRQLPKRARAGSAWRG